MGDLMEEDKSGILLFQVQHNELREDLSLPSLANIFVILFIDWLQLSGSMVNTSHLGSNWSQFNIFQERVILLKVLVHFLWGECLIFLHF